ncbi:MAG: ankyrin repeat domain-containing protein [Bdellovibrionales bacterium]|nr:ankyrin repeat domain-containing protein [Bdellovibrionales bacterium]
MILRLYISAIFVCFMLFSIPGFGQTNFFGVEELCQNLLTDVEEPIAYSFCGDLNKLFLDQDDSQFSSSKEFLESHFKKSDIESIFCYSHEQQTPWWYDRFSDSPEWASNYQKISRFLNLMLKQVNFKKNLPQNCKDFVYLRSARIAEFELVKKALKGGADIDALDDKGMNGLHHAAEVGDTELFVFLTKKGVDIDARKTDKLAYSVFDQAVLFDRYEIAMFLLDRGVDLSRKEGTAFSGFSHALFSSPKIALGILAKRPEIVEEELAYPVTEDNYCLLGMAVAFQTDYDLVEKLLKEHNIDVNQKNGDGGTALFTAAKWLQYDILTLLLSYGADPTIKNNKGQNILESFREGNLSSLIFADLSADEREKEEAVQKVIALLEKAMQYPDLFRKN